MHVFHHRETLNVSPCTVFSKSQSPKFGSEEPTLSPVLSPAVSTDPVFRVPLFAPTNNGHDVVDFVRLLEILFQWDDTRSIVDEVVRIDSARNRATVEDLELKGISSLSRSVDRAVSINLRVRVFRNGLAGSPVICESITVSGDVVRFTFEKSILNLSTESFGRIRGASQVRVLGRVSKTSPSRKIIFFLRGESVLNKRVRSVRGSSPATSNLGVLILFVGEWTVENVLHAQSNVRSEVLFLLDSDPLNAVLKAGDRCMSPAASTVLRKMLVEVGGAPALLTMVVVLRDRFVSSLGQI
mmetsp:Transcript_5668/g.11244  ORF Transcript_5668/g.11244 Transcript_5668/m.11244 type:complete len:298 (-) Transcript_5668:190-1083(-)